MASSAYNLHTQLTLSKITVSSSAISSLQKQLKNVKANINVNVRVPKNALNVLAQIQSKLSSITLSAQNFGNAMMRAGNAGVSINQRVANSYRNIHSATRNTLTSSASLARSIQTLTGQWLGLYQAVRLVREGLKDFREFQDTQVNIGQISGQDIGGPAASQIGRATRQSATRWGANSQDVLEMSTALLQSNVPLREVVASVDMLSKLTLNKQVQDTQQLSDAIIVLRSSFGQNAQEVEQSLSKNIALAKQFASDVEGQVKAIKIAGSTFKQYGGSVDTLNAAFVSLKQKTRLADEAIATSLRTILTRIYSAPDVSKQLQEKLGLSFYTDEGAAKKPLEVIREISQALSSLPSEKRNPLLTLIGGVRQSTATSALFSDISLFNEVYGKSVAATNDITRDAEIAQESLSVQLQKNKELWKANFENLANSDGAKTAIAAFLELNSTLADTLPLLLKIGAVAGTIGLGKLALGNLKTAGFGALGVGALYGASKVQVQDQQSAYGKAGLQGVGAFGLLVASGINPAVAALGGLGIAASQLGDTFRELATYEITKDAGPQAQRLELQQQRGLLSPGALAELRRSANTVRSASKRADEKPSWWSTQSWFGFNEAGTLKNEQRERERQRTEFNKAYRPTVEANIDKYVGAFIDSGLDMSAFDTWQGGILTTLEEMDDMTNDMVGINFNSNLREIVAKELEARKQTTATVEAMADDAEEIAAKMKERVAEITAYFAQKANTTAAYGNYRDSRIATETQRRQLSGTSMAGIGDLIGQDVRNQAGSLAGVSSLQGIQNRLFGLLEAQQNAGGDSKLFQGAIDNTVSGLRLLADSSKQVSAYMGELSEVTATLNAKYQAAESFYSSDKQGRQGIIDDKAAFDALAKAGFDLNKLTIEQQQASLRHLNRSSQLEMFGSGFTGEDIKRATLEKSVGSGEFKLEKDKQTQLQEKIIAVMEQSEKASKILFDYEAQLQRNFFTTLSGENRAFLDSLSSIMGVDKPDGASPAYKFEVPTLPSLTPTPTPTNRPEVDLDELMRRAGQGATSQIDRLIRPDMLGRSAEEINTPTAQALTIPAFEDRQDVLDYRKEQYQKEMERRRGAYTNRFNPQSPTPTMSDTVKDMGHRVYEFTVDTTKLEGVLDKFHSPTTTSQADMTRGGEMLDKFSSKPIEIDTTKMERVLGSLDIPSEITMNGDHQHNHTITVQGLEGIGEDAMREVAKQVALQVVNKELTKLDQTNNNKIA